MAKIYYIGDWAVLTGPVFAETPFNYSHKGLEIYNYGKWLKAAFESTGKHQVESVPTWDFYKLPPGEWERILDIGSATAVMGTLICLMLAQLKLF